MEFDDATLEKMALLANELPKLIAAVGGTDKDYKLAAGVLRGMILSEPEGDGTTIDRITEMNEYSQECTRIFRSAMEPPPPEVLNGR